MKKFKLVYSSNKEEFEKEVEKYLNEGYEINGNVSKSENGYIITLIKKEKIEIPIEESKISSKKEILFSTKLVNEKQVEIQEGKLVSFDENPFYKNIVGLRKPFLKYEYSIDETKIINNYRKNPLLFFNSLYITTYNDLSRIKLRDYQEEILKNYFDYKYNINMMSRQLGSSLINSLISLYEACINGKKIIILCNTKSECFEIIEKIENLYKNLLFYIKPGILNMNRTHMIFDNAGEINTYVYAKYFNIGKKIDVCIFSDFAHSQFSENIYTNLYPTLSSENGKIIINSSPNGNNFFYKLFQNAERLENDPLKTNFKANRYYWFQVPRSKEWMYNLIDMIGKDKFNMEYNLQII